MKIIWNNEARVDLNEVRNFISKEGEFYARKVVSEIYTKIELILSIFPEAGMKIKKHEDIYKLRITGTSYVVLYRIYQENVYILRVLHVARKWINYI
jgi:toxin ParE1/3/4